MIRAQSVSKEYKSNDQFISVLRSIDLEVEAGVSVALTGESGSGKSTLLHLLAGLDTPTSGEISAAFPEDDVLQISGASEATRAEIRRKHFGIIFQQFNLIPSLTNWQNLVFGAKLADRFDEDWSRALASKLGLGDTLDRYPDEISGGQQQRLAVARAFASRPRIILADEPTGNLDEANGDRVLELAFELVSDMSVTMIIATHSEKVAAFADKRFHLDHGALACR